MRIGVDVDSVLADIMDELIEFFNKETGENIILEDIKGFDIENVWKISLNESVELVEEFFYECFNKIPPIKGSIENIQLLKEKGHDLHIVTARPSEFKEKTIEWIKEIYGSNTFSAYFFNDRFRDPSAPKKSEVMIENEIDLLIDDDPRNYMECVKDGVSCVLLNVDNKFPWARTKDPNLVKASSWDEAVTKVNNLILIKNKMNF